MASEVFTFALIGGAILSSPPAHYEALSAVQRAVDERASLSYYFAPGADITSRKNYPVDVQLYSCEPIDGLREEGLPNARIGQTGHRCILDIFPLAEADFRVQGIFFHDGYDWRYYGSLFRTLVVEADQFGEGLGVTQVTPKDGAITYNGQPYGRRILENPYTDILDFATRRREREINNYSTYPTN